MAGWQQRRREQQQHVRLLHVQVRAAPSEQDLPDHPRRHRRAAAHVRDTRSRQPGLVDLHCFDDQDGLFLRGPSVAVDSSNRSCYGLQTSPIDVEKNRDRGGEAVDQLVGTLHAQQSRAEFGDDAVPSLQGYQVPSREGPRGHVHAGGQVLLVRGGTAEGVIAERLPNRDLFGSPTRIRRSLPYQSARL